MQDSYIERWPYAKDPSKKWYYGHGETFDLVAKFLDHPGILEDWGCGTCTLKDYIKQATYRGIDGSTSDYNDITADLRYYRSKADYILLKHVLEHNPDWRMILQNALASFRKRLVVVFYTPFSAETHDTYFHEDVRVPAYSFKKSEITDLLIYPYTEEVINGETIFYVQKI